MAFIGEKKGMSVVRTVLDSFTEFLKIRHLAFATDTVKVNPIVLSFDLFMNASQFLRGIIKDDQLAYLFHITFSRFDIIKHFDSIEFDFAHDLPVLVDKTNSLLTDSPSKPTDPFLWSLSRFSFVIFSKRVRLLSEIQKSKAKPCLIWAKS